MKISSHAFVPSDRKKKHRNSSQSYVVGSSLTPRLLREGITQESAVIKELKHIAFSFLLIRSIVSQPVRGISSP